MASTNRLDFSVTFQTDKETTSMQLAVIQRVVERHIKDALDGFTAVDYNSIEIKVV